MKKYFLLLVVISIVGCKSDNSGITPTDPMVSFREKAQAVALQQNSIEVPEVPQLALKSVILTLREKNEMTFPTYNFAYNSQNSLVSITSGTEGFWSLALNGNQASLKYDESIQEFILGNNGLGEKANITFEGKKSEIHYLYKNGYWVSSYNTDGDITSRIYSQKGDLLQWKIVDINGNIKYNATYEYTDIPNTIRQEVNRWEAPHFSFRGDVLGKYSSQLLKKVTINNTSTLSFDYKLDDKNRVSSSTISRTQGTFELPVAFYSYTY
jgi:hypothetical protein